MTPDGDLRYDTYDDPASLWRRAVDRVIRQECMRLGRAYDEVVAIAGTPTENDAAGSDSRSTLDQVRLVAQTLGIPAKHLMSLADALIQRWVVEWGVDHRLPMDFADFAILLVNQNRRRVLTTCSLVPDARSDALADVLGLSLQVVDDVLAVLEQLEAVDKVDTPKGPTYCVRPGIRSVLLAAVGAGFVRPPGNSVSRLVPG